MSNAEPEPEWYPLDGVSKAQAYRVCKACEKKARKK